MMDDQCSERQGSDPVDSHELPPRRPPPRGLPGPERGVAALRSFQWTPADTQTTGTQGERLEHRATVQLGLEHAERPETLPSGGA